MGIKPVTLLPNEVKSLLSEGIKPVTLLPSEVKSLLSEVKTYSSFVFVFEKTICKDFSNLNVFKTLTNVLINPLDSNIYFTF